MELNNYACARGVNEVIPNSKYQKQKIAIKKWRENNKEYFYELNKKHVKKWIENNKERYR